MILTDIGEVGITVGERHVKLRPSLHAMSRLGEPHEIVEIFADVMSPVEGKYQFESALSVLCVCAGDEDVSDIFGHFDFVDGKCVYVDGSAPKDHVLLLARCLLKHGIVSALPPLPVKDGEKPKYENIFDARSYVSIAMAHLGSSSLEAWSMTMTELVGALRAKFPPQSEASKRQNTSAGRAPTLAEHEATMAWFDEIELKRKKRSGAH